MYVLVGELLGVGSEVSKTPIPFLVGLFLYLVVVDQDVRSQLFLHFTIMDSDPLKVYLFPNKSFFYKLPWPWCLISAIEK